MSKFEFKNILGAILLSAGFSNRMKKPKPFLPFNNEFVFIEKIIGDYLDYGCNQIIITFNESHNEWMRIREKYLNTQSIIFQKNPHPEYERFYSIKVGLEKLDEDVKYCFIHNTDNPFIDNNILELLYNNRTDDGYIVPIHLGKGGHPILIGKKVIRSILSEDNLNLNFREFLAKFARKNTNVDSNIIHININNEAEYKKYFI